jgi:hypothetical protein
VFVLAFVVEVVVEYNLFMHKTQPQKLIFLIFCGFFNRSHTQPQPPPQIQTHTKSSKFLKILWSVSVIRGDYFLFGLVFIKKIIKLIFLKEKN